MIKKILKGLAALLVLAVAVAILFPQIQFWQFKGRSMKGTEGAIGEKGMVVSAHPLASQVGLDILKAGGNAFDAVVATHYALTVVYPQAGNIGGGGFLVWRDKDGGTGSLDFREKAPLAAHRDMYLDDKGNVIRGLSLKGPLAVGVPGSVDGMEKIIARFGSLPRQVLIQPSINLARDGYALTAKNARMLNRYQQTFSDVNRHDAAAIKDGGWSKDDLFIQPALANTLARIATEGRDGFYGGQTADMIVAEMQASGGLISHDDLNQYQAQWRDPIVFDYRGHKITSMPPPSSGGIALAQLLQGAEAFPVGAMGHNSTAHIHMMTELERRVYADRATHLGDTDYVEVDIDTLTSPAYITARMADIDPGKKTDSQDVKPGNVDVIESVETTHISIVDQWGNAVSVTTTLNGNFGSKLIVKDAGFFLNNEMDDFSIKPGHANQFGLVGNEKNAIEPGKRMLSSMTPTIIEKDGQLRMVVGTPGGSTIITSVFQTIMNVIDFNMTAQQAVNARKSHHQWQPDLVLLERGNPHVLTLMGLAIKGHVPVIWPWFEWELGRVEAVLVRDDGSLEGAADHYRGEDDTAMGY